MARSQFMTLVLAWDLKALQEGNKNPVAGFVADISDSEEELKDRLGEVARYVYPELEISVDELGGQSLDAFLNLSTRWYQHMELKQMVNTREYGEA